MLFGKKKKVRKEYDRERFEPVLRSSICTGETTAGLYDKTNGTFVEVMLVRDGYDLEEFREMYDVKGDLRTIY